MSILFGLILLACLPAEEKHPVPPAKEQDEIRERLYRLYKNEYARPNPKELKTLAEKLHEASQGEKSNSAARYVMLTEAIKLSAKGGDLDRTLQITKDINENFKCENLDKLLGEMLADAFGANFQVKELTQVAGLELAKPIKPPELVCKEWLDIGTKMNGNYKVVVFRRARKLAMDALSAGNVNGLRKTEMEQLCKSATNEIDKYDAKFRRFSLYEGKWVIKYENGYISEYVISIDGELEFDRTISPDGTPFVKKDEQRAKLSRRGDDVVILFVKTNVLERLRIEGEKLVVDRFDPANRYPNSPNNKGNGVRENR